MLVIFKQDFSAAHRRRGRPRQGSRHQPEYPPSQLVDTLVCIFKETEVPADFDYSRQSFVDLLNQFNATTLPCDISRFSSRHSSRRSRSRHES